MVKPRCLPIHKASAGVATFAGIGGGQMVLRLTQGGRLLAIVTGKAAAYHIDVIEFGTCPSHKVIAIMAIGTAVG
jgi:hypothetical protein